MRILTISFDYNIPSEWTITNTPDRIINVYATASEHDGVLGLPHLEVKIVDTTLADLWKPVNIYTSCLDIASKKLEEKLKSGSGFGELESIKHTEAA